MISERAHSPGAQRKLLAYTHSYLEIKQESVTMTEYSLRAPRKYVTASSRKRTPSDSDECTTSTASGSGSGMRRSDSENGSQSSLSNVVSCCTSRGKNTYGRPKGQKNDRTMGTLSRLAHYLPCIIALYVSLDLELDAHSHIDRVSVDAFGMRRVGVKPPMNGAVGSSSSQGASSSSSASASAPVQQTWSQLGQKVLS